MSERACAEHFDDPGARAPQRRRLHAGWWRQIFAQCLEQPADEAVRRPVGEADLAARLADPEHFGRGLVLIGGEHHAERRNDGIEARGRKRQRLGVGFAEVDGEPLGRGPLLAAREQRRHVVGRRDVAEAARRGQRDVAVAGCDVEHLAAGAQVECFAQLLADDLQRGADHRVVARRPGGLLAGLEPAEIGLRCGSGFEGGGLGHGFLLVLIGTADRQDRSCAAGPRCVLWRNMRQPVPRDFEVALIFP